MTLLCKIKNYKIIESKNKDEEKITDSFQSCFPNCIFVLNVRNIDIFGNYVSLFVFVSSKLLTLKALVSNFP